jgi:ferredoxin
MFLIGYDTNSEDIMSAKIYYYSGTGNSLWVSKKISDELGGAEIVSISKSSDHKIEKEYDVVGFVFPVHVWGVPRKMVEFVEQLKLDSSKHYFAVAVNAGQVAKTLVQFKKILKPKKVNLSIGFELNMPSNYIPWAGYDPVDKQKSKMSAALNKIKDYSLRINKRESAKLEKGSFFSSIFFSFVYKISYNQVPALDKKFSVDEKCNGCGICEKVCPAKNIIMKNNKPAWQHKCEQCLACIQWCPQEAIQYQNKTAGYKRYHNPEIKVKEMFQKDR